MRRITFREVAVVVWVIAAAVVVGPVAAEETSADHPARETLAQLLVSDAVDRIDFETTSYEEGMGRIYRAVDTIIEMNRAGEADLLADQASQVIEALNAQKARGMAVTFGKGVDSIPVRNDGEARMLGELVGTTLAIIREQFGEGTVSYRDKAAGIFRSVILDPEDPSPVVQQYLEGVQLVAEQPPGQRHRYFK